MTVGFIFISYLITETKPAFGSFFLTRNDSTDKGPIIYHFKNTSIEKYQLKFMNMQVSQSKEFFAHMSYCPVTVTCVLTIPELCCIQSWFCFHFQV